MLHYAAVFFVIAIIAAVFGFTGIAAGAAEIAKILFYIFLVVFAVTLLLGVVRTWLGDSGKARARCMLEWRRLSANTNAA